VAGSSFASVQSGYTSTIGGASPVGVARQAAFLSAYANQLSHQTANSSVSVIEYQREFFGDSFYQLIRRLRHNFAFPPFP
jgi:hypothetical protein